MAVIENIKNGIGRVAKVGAKATLSAAGTALKYGGKASWAVTKEAAKTAGYAFSKIGHAAIDFSEGVGAVGIAIFGTAQGRRIFASRLGHAVGNIGGLFVKSDKKTGALKPTAFGVLAIAGSGMLANSRDIYSKEKARHMGQIDNQKRTNTPLMTVPEYSYSPPRRMGALDGGASGDLVFALHNNR